MTPELIIEILTNGGANLIIIYTLMSWKRADNTAAQERLTQLTNNTDETAKQTAAALQRIGDEMDKLSNQLTRLDVLITTTSSKEKTNNG